MSKTQILVASDDAQIRQMARDAAQAEGLEALLCGDGEEAVESARRSTPGPLKLVVLEAFLPKLDGFEVVKRLQESPQTRELPVLMLIGQKGGPFRSGGKTPHKLPTVRLGAD